MKSPARCATWRGSFGLFNRLLDRRLLAFFELGVDDVVVTLGRASSGGSLRARTCAAVAGVRGRRAVGDAPAISFMAASSASLCDAMPSVSLASIASRSDFTLPSMSADLVGRELVLDLLEAFSTP